MVSTPFFFLDRLFFSDLSYLVIDEADSMFDSSFKSDTMEILQSISVSRHVPSLLHIFFFAYALDVRTAHP